MTRMRPRDAGVDERFERLLALQEMLTRVARRIGPALELEPVLREALLGMRALVNFKGGTICLVDERGVYVAAADPPVSPEVADARVPVGSGLAGRCVTSGEAVYSPDLDHDDRVDPRLRKLGSNRTMHTYLAVPLVCLGQVIGVMQVDSEEVDAFDADDLRVLEGLAAQVAGAIESARHHEANRRLDDARAMFVARVSHELRTPLTIVLGLTHTIMSNRNRFGVAGELHELLGRIDAAGGRLHALIEELITMGALETGMLLHADTHDVLVAPVLDRAAAESLSPDQIEVDCPPDLRAQIDPVLLAQALHLLLQNALTYAGRALLTATRGASGTVEIHVIDQGPGIPDDRKAAVFERFHRGEHPGHGWGLGLSVVRQLATAVGAELKLTDTPGGGATFTLVLPSITQLL